MAKCNNCKNELIYTGKEWAHIIPTKEKICGNPIPEGD